MEIKELNKLALAIKKGKKAKVKDIAIDLAIAEFAVKACTVLDRIKTLSEAADDKRDGAKAAWALIDQELAELEK